MKRFIFTVSLLLLLSGPHKAIAWGAKGHAMIAEIAFRYMDEPTRKIVLKYLNGMTFEEAANWMDYVRGCKLPGSSARRIKVNKTKLVNFKF